MSSVDGRLLNDRWTEPFDGLSGVPSIFEYVGGATDCPAAGQLKTFIDRTFGRYREMKDKEFFYLTACADPEESTADWAVNAFRGFVMCLPNPTER